MKAWKVVGYIFVCLGTLCFLYGFFVGVTETINLTTALFMDSSGSSMDSFFSLFLFAIAPWMVLASALFIVGGVGLFLGRDKNKVKLSTDQENICERIEMLERTIDRNFQSVSNRLDAIEKQQKEQART
jgi:hypothetical protein